MRSSRARSDAAITGSVSRSPEFWEKQRRVREGCDDMREDRGARAARIEVREDDHGEPVIRIARAQAREALPGIAVLDELVSVLSADDAATALAARIRLAVVERKDRPDAVEAGLLEQPRRGERLVPPREVAHDHKDFL